MLDTKTVGEIKKSYLPFLILKQIEHLYTARVPQEELGSLAMWILE